MINKDWWDFPFNPVKGCLGGCKYCYASKIVKRFRYAEHVAMAELSYKYGCPPWPYEEEYDQLVDDIKAFKPTFFEYVLAQKLRKKPTKYFFSMSDPYYWKQEWYEKIVNRIAENMQHTFMVLTKHPEVYQKYTFSHNILLGVTITDMTELMVFEAKLSNFLEIPNLFISFEPIKEKIKISSFMRFCLDWIIVGPETGNRKDKYICTPEMLEPFFDLDIPVFMKGACAKVTDSPLRQEWPE